MRHLHFVPAPASSLRARLAGVVASLAACAALGLPADALGGTATLGVVAHVRSWTRVETTAAPAVLVVTAGDVQRGWVEVGDAVVLAVRSNARHGPSVVVLTGGDLVRQGVLTGFSDPVHFGPGQGTIQLPPQKPVERLHYQLNVRLQLAAGVTPGEYAFPLRFLALDDETVSAAAR